MEKFFVNYESMTQKWVEEEALKAQKKPLHARDEVFGAKFNIETPFGKVKTESGKVKSESSAESKGQEGDKSINREGLRVLLHQSLLFFCQDFLDAKLKESLRSFLILQDVTLLSYGWKLTWGKAKKHLFTQSQKRDVVFPILAGLVCKRRPGHVILPDWIRSVQVFEKELAEHGVQLPPVTWTAIVWDQMNKEERALIKRKATGEMLQQVSLIDPEEVPSFNAYDVRAFTNKLPMFSEHGAAKKEPRASSSAGRFKCDLHKINQTHNTEDCNVKCNRCKKPGHKEFTCPTKSAAGKAKCFECGSTDHMRPDCPKRKNGKARAAASYAMETTRQKTARQQKMYELYEKARARSHPPGMPVSIFSDSDSD